MTNTTPQWEKEFDEKFTNSGTIWVNGKIGLSLDPIKDFIKNLLSTHTNALREIRDRLEEHRIKRHNGEDDYGELTQIVWKFDSLLSEEGK